MPRTSPRRVIVIASSPRTGSTLLAQALAETGRAGVPEEYLNYQQLMRDRYGFGPVRLTWAGRLGQIRRRLRGDPDWARTSVQRFSRRGVREIIDLAAERSTSDDGTFSIKIHWDQFARVMLAHGFDASVWGAPVQWIWTRRTDELRQAISWVRAQQTRRWSAIDPSPTDPAAVEVYDPDLIELYMERRRRDIAAWEHYFADAGITPLTVTYEELDEQYTPTIARVLSYLGIDAPVPPPPMRRQADAVTEEWLRRYVAERGSPTHRATD